MTGPTSLPIAPSQSINSAAPIGRPRPRWLEAGTILVSLIAFMPIAAIVWIAAAGDTGDLGHVVDTILPRALGRTLVLLSLIAIATGITGIATAWLVAACDFPGRKFFSSALVLPLAIPSYLAAYAAGEFFDFTGPLQTAIRAIFGYQTARDYWFFEIRSTGGAVMVLGSVLYPYVYLACRSMFLMQGRQAADVARTLGASPLRVFFKIQIPMARPAIMIGLTLVMMETLNDIGAVEYLGVNTLTFAIYDTWLNRGNLGGAAQIAAVMLVVVAFLVMAERYARRRQRFSAQKTTSMVHDAVRLKLVGFKAALAILACGLPVLGGFVIPVIVLGGFAMRRLDQFVSARLFTALGNTIMVAGLTAAITVIFAFLFSYSARRGRGRISAAAARLASFGYGVPGTVLAIGVLVPLAGFDNALSSFMRDHFGVNPGLLLSGSVIAIVYAASVRFLTMAEGTVDAGFQKLSPHLDHAARTLGRTSTQTLKSVLIPLMRPAALTAGLLVFIETIKELSATILLRPFNFNTLATLVYEDASRAHVEDASVAAMIIMLAGLVPVILVSRSMERRG